MAVWWKEEVAYQIYPRSFKDSNGDGVGDIRGIITQLPILKDLGIGIIWLSPVYLSPNYDNGYDIADYRDINPEYGSMADMDELIEKAKTLNIRIVMDLVVNHTSSEHEWFKKSIKKIEPYTDYYIWRDGKGDLNPNNWGSFFAEDAWEYNEERGQYYLHLFAKEQPDLNYYNPLVLQEVKDIMKFWLEKGVGGFRCDVINIMYKSTLEDGKKQFAVQGIEHYLNTEGNHQILKELRKDVLDHYDCFTVGETILVTPKTAKELCGKDRKELDMIFSFEHMEADQYLIKWFKRKLNKKKFFQTISTWQKELDWNANYLENHDQLRSVSRFGNTKKYWEKSAKLLATLLLTLRGTPFIYQGEEIGMTNFDYTNLSQIDDIESHNANAWLRKRFVPKWYRWRMITKASRDNVRTPLQWNDSKNGGFTDGVPWLGVNKNYKHINYESQLNDNNSIWNYYKSLIYIRKNHLGLITGKFNDIFIGKKLFVYERVLENERIIIALNLSKSSVKITYNGETIINNYEEENFSGILKPYQAIVYKG